MKLNLNTILALLACLGVFAPDIASVASALAALHISWMAYVVKGLSLLAAFCAAAPLIVPKLRPLLSLLGLATAPGAVAPWIPGKPGDPELPAAQQAAELAKEATTPIRGVPTVRKGDGGHTVISILFWGALAGLLAAGLFLALSPRLARADTQQFGGCFNGGSMCAGPSATVTVGAFNFATSKFSGGLTPGLGYGLTYAPGQWYATGVAAYLSFSVGGSEPNHAMPSLMFSFANYVRVGAGMAITEQDVGTLKQWSLLFGLGSDFGGSPKYVRAQEVRAVQAEKAEADKAEPRKAE